MSTLSDNDVELSNNHVNMSDLHVHLSDMMSTCQIILLLSVRMALIGQKHVL